MKSIYTLIFFYFLSPFTVASQQNYWEYHRAVIKAEQFIVQDNHPAALAIYQELFKTYEFIFVREYQVATQLAWDVGNKKAAFSYIKKGIEGGWEMKYIKSTTYLNQLRHEPEWKQIRSNYKQLRAVFEAKKKSELGQQVHEMSKADQWNALKALFTFSSAAQDRYAERVFAPHSELQMAKLQSIINEHGYPGERLVGVSLWMSTILSHHSSISTAYVQQDSLYPKLRPQLLKAIGDGDLSPYKFSIIEDWRLAVKSNRQAVSYGFLNQIWESQLVESNKMREKLAMRSVELRNQLVDVEKKTGMYFYMEGKPWVKEKITVTK